MLGEREKREESHRKNSELLIGAPVLTARISSRYSCDFKFFLIVALFIKVDRVTLAWPQFFHVSVNIFIFSSCFPNISLKSIHVPVISSSLSVSLPATCHNISVCDPVMEG